MQCRQTLRNPRNWLHVLWGWCFQNDGIVLYYLLCELHKLFELSHLDFADTVSNYFDCFNAVGNCMHNLINMCAGGVHAVIVTDLCHIRELLASCDIDLAYMSAVLLCICGEVTSFD